MLKSQILSVKKYCSCSNLVQHYYTLGYLITQSIKSKGVLVGIFDTGNYWKHPDFRDPTDQTKSRIVKMWIKITPTGTEVLTYGFHLMV